MWKLGAEESVSKGHDVRKTRGVIAGFADIGKGSRTKDSGWPL